MPDFYRTFVNDANFIRGAGRIMWANMSQAFPVTCADMVNLSTYDAASGWNDLGATKNGIQITVNNTEEVFDVDQILGDLDSRPSAWDVEVVTQLAEMDESRLQLAWEGGAINTVGGELQMGVGAPTVYARRRLAVLFPKSVGGATKIRAFVFRKVQRAPQESTISYSKTGEQQSVPTRFRALADASIADPYARFFMIYDQQ